MAKNKKRVVKKRTTAKKRAIRKDYSKRPLWQWVVIYAIVGGIIYTALYYFVLPNRNAANDSASLPYSEEEIFE